MVVISNDDCERRRKMHPRVTTCFVLPLALVAMLLGPRAAWAQEHDDKGASTTAQSSDHLTLEPVQEGVVIAPDVRFGRVNGRDAYFMGAYGGWMVDKTILVGGGGYWLTNRDHDFEMQYGGVVVEWLSHATQRIGFGTRALVGGGTATLRLPYGEVFGAPPPSGVWPDDGRPGHGHGHVPQPTPHTPITSTTPIVVWGDYFVFEPQANLLIGITPWLRVNAGVGYRAIAGANEMNDHLRGASGTVSLQIGGGN